MKLIINGEISFFDLPEVTIEKILALRGFPAAGTAVAVNNKLVRKENWSMYKLREDDSMTIISAAFGG